jgi:hypothetical protein
MFLLMLMSHVHGPWFICFLLLCIGKRRLTSDEIELTSDYHTPMELAPYYYTLTTRGRAMRNEVGYDLMDTER